MKFSTVAIVVAGIVASTLSVNALAGFPTKQQPVHVTNFTGKMSGGTNNGFVSLTYPITVESGYDSRKFFYSQSGTFKNQTADKEAYYNGVQPQGNGIGQFVFSLFGGKGAHVIDTQHCRQGADNYAIGGVSCAIKLPYTQGVTYNFTAYLKSHTETDNVWVGEVEDTSTGIKTQIGSWSTPASIGYLSGQSIGFIEDYVAHMTCNEIPETTALFGAPKGLQENDSLEYSGSISKAYAVAQCKGKVAFTSEKLPDGGLRVEQQQGQRYQDGPAGPEQ